MHRNKLLELYLYTSRAIFMEKYSPKQLYNSASTLKVVVSNSISVMEKRDDIQPNDDKRSQLFDIFT